MSEATDQEAVAKMRGLLGWAETHEDECLEWTGSVDPVSGYGRVWVGGRGGRNYPVHRLAMCVKENYDYAEIDGWLVRHQCNNRLCYNPHHLLLGDDRQNVLDRVFAGRSGVAKGEHNARAKLTDEQVSDIRALHERGWRLVAIADAFGISSVQVGRIVRHVQR